MGKEIHTIAVPFFTRAPESQKTDAFYQYFQRFQILCLIYCMKLCWFRCDKVKTKVMYLLSAT